MARLISLLVFAGLVAALYLVPTADPMRIAAYEGGALLTEASTSDGDRLLWQELIDSPAATRTGQDTVVVRLGGSRLRAEHAAVGDPALHGEVRRSIVRALRAIAADDGGPGDLTFEGLHVGVADGANFLLEVGPDTLALSFQLPDDTTYRAVKEWRPATRGSLAPPLLAILLAILFRRPVLALFAGVWIGAFLELFGAGRGALASAGTGLGNIFTKYLYGEVTNRFRIEIILFVFFMLAMVGVMTRAGGIHGLMNRISKIAYTVRRTQIATSLMGFAVFFDDYANTILVGSTMRPLTDRFKIAREKLAYIVDSTAAPVAGLSIFSTWIAFEVSTFSAQLPDAELAPGDGYAVFVQTLPYRFYCWLTLFFVVLVASTGRDFGPMLRAERRARGGKLLRDGAKPMIGEHATRLEPLPGLTPRALLAVAPLVTFIFVTLFEIARAGGAFSMGASVFSMEGLAQVLYDGSGGFPLMVGSGAGLVLSAILAYAVGLRGEIVTAAWACVRSMLIAVVILFLAWMIGAVCNELGTAAYLTVLLGDAVPAIIVPCVLFLLAGIVAFSTGSSWSTMSILLPLVVGFSFTIGEASDIGGHLLMVMSIGAVLEGAIFGDHCSPISDTTVMSSIASASDHIDHVRTQAPYAITTMLVALVFGYFPCTFLGLNPFLALAICAAVLVLILRIYGRKAEDVVSEPVPASLP